MGAMSKATKEFVVSKVLKDLYAKEVQKLVKDVHEKIRATYLYEWDKFDWKSFEAMKGYIRVQSFLGCGFALGSNRVGSSYRDIYSRLGFSGLFEVSLSRGFPCYPYDNLKVSEKFKKKAIEIYTPLLAFLDKVSGVAKNMEEVMSSINTANQAAELLPEIVKYLPNDQVKSLLPVPIEKVNKVRAVLRENNVSGK